jgi:lipid-binding SYLF domain-containing protein
MGSWTLSASAAVKPGEAARLTAATEVVQTIQTAIPQDLWSRARCVAVIPDLKKAAFIVGGEYGKGVMSCRSGDGWSAPVFMQLVKGSWGLQVGAQQIDLVLLVMNEHGVQKLLQNKVNLGVDASVAAGPVGRQASASTDAQLKAEILSYSRAQGLFAGIDLSGGVLRPDADANESAYGPGAAPRTILASRGISAPTEATPFLNALKTETTPETTARAGSPTSAAGSQTGAAAASSPASSDADLRARIAEMQQTIDGLLSESKPSAVGTTGAPGAGAATDSGTVTVERAKLLQLRQQLDALATALSRR